MKRVLLCLAMALSVLPSAYSQTGKGEQRDSLVRLLSADLARLIEYRGESYRRVDGNAQFLHNDAYLYCDTAMWNVDREWIDAKGHVQIVQDETTLTGDSLRYNIKTSTASFRGGLVELSDAKGNILRTKHLDYNTRDSLAWFFNGGAMKDSSGAVIESRRGTYDSRAKLFTFGGKVEMFSDSLFFVSDTLRYFTENEYARFNRNTKAWFRRNFLSAGAGWYDKKREHFFFEKNVYVLTDDYQAWCDSLYYERYEEYLRMNRNVQLLDTANNVMAMAGVVEYWDNPKRSLLYRSPAVAMVQDAENGGKDTLFLAADTLLAYQLPMWQIERGEVERAKERHDLALIDAIEQQKISSAMSRGDDDDFNIGRGKNIVPPPSESDGHDDEEDYPVRRRRWGRKARAEQARLDSLKVIADSLARIDSLHRADSVARVRRIADSLTRIDSLHRADSIHLADSLKKLNFVRDSVDREQYRKKLVHRGLDSLAIADSLHVRDSIAALPPKDTTTVSIFKAFHRVKVFKSDMQMVCDSLIYTSIDSIARLYRDPVIWKDVKDQFFADSIQIVIHKEELKKALLQTNAFVVIEQTPGEYYNQVKSPEMVAYFKDNTLNRFDAMGGVGLLFFMAEDSVHVSMVNQKESRLLSATFKDGSINRIKYIESIKSDVYPIWRMGAEKQKLKNFKWVTELRPEDRFAVTNLSVRPSRRGKVIATPQFPIFPQSGIYFEGYIEGVMEQIRRREVFICTFSK